jgi:hypothetical protein
LKRTAVGAALLGSLLVMSGCVVMELPQVAAGAIDLFDQAPEQIHVAPWGDDTNPGTKALPVETIQFALSLIPLQDAERFEVRVAAGDYTPGNGLIGEGQHGVMYRYNYHQPRSDRDWLSVHLSFGWDRLFETNNPATGGGVTHLRGYGVYEGGAIAAVLAFYDADEELQGTTVNLENSYATDAEVTVFAASFLGEFELTVSGSLEVTP